MFLVDSAQAAADWEGTLSVIETILKRADAEVVSMQKWQERKLAYDIDHKTRGTYILSYFKADGPRIAGIEKDVLLSEKVMRVLVLGTEKRPAEMIERDIKGEPAEKTVESTAPPAPAKEPKNASAEPAQDAEPGKPAETPAEPAASSAAEPESEVAATEPEKAAE
jgi:small subunit ribosomal protein S6